MSAKKTVVIVMATAIILSVFVGMFTLYRGDLNSDTVKAKYISASHKVVTPTSIKNIEKIIEVLDPTQPSEHGNESIWEAANEQWDILSTQGASYVAGDVTTDDAHTSSQEKFMWIVLRHSVEYGTYTLSPLASWASGHAGFTEASTAQQGDIVLTAANQLYVADGSGSGIGWNSAAETKTKLNPINMTGAKIWHYGSASTPSTPSTPTTPTNPSNEAVYNILVQNGFGVKAKAMSEAYAAAQPVYGKNFAIGLMANINGEGNYGQIEGYRSSNHYWSQVSGAVVALAGRVISNSGMVDVLLTVPGSISGVGVGSIQWSGGRRVGILNKYKASCSMYSTDDLGAADVSFMMDELAGDYHSVPAGCANKDAASCASDICLYYERPKDKQQRAVERAATAGRLATMLGSVE